MSIPSVSLAAAVDHPGEAADDDVADPLVVERLQQRVRVKRGLSLTERRELFEQRLHALLRRLQQTLLESASSASSWSGSAISSLSTKPHASTTARRFSKLGSARRSPNGRSAPGPSAALRQLGLREPASHPCLLDNPRARHREILRRVDNTTRAPYVTTLCAPRRQLSLQLLERIERPAAPRAPRERNRRLPRLALSPDEAAAVLGVSRDYLDEHVIDELRVVRRGRRILIALAELERWLDRSATRVSVGRA